MIFSSVIYAPFVEEIIFRKSIKNVIKNPYIFIIISGFLFGILHINDYKNFSEILMGIPYIIMGLDFAYIYHKTNNIFTTMTFHFCHNLILLLIQLI
jgi:membrane protease YdiL (CAAX protease family)